MVNENRWYTVTSDVYTEWDRGSYSIVEATEILKEAIADGEENAVIAVIDEGDENNDECFCIEEIALEDAERVAKAEIHEACIAVIMEENDSESVIGGQDVWTVEAWFDHSTEDEIAELTERDLAESMMEMGYHPEYEIVDGAIVFPGHEIACVDGNLYRLCEETSGGHIVVDSHNFRRSDRGTTYATDRYYVVEKGMMIDLGRVWENDMKWADEM